jgi:hypothetical protein
MAKHVLDSLPDPTKVAIPRDVEDRSRHGQPVPNLSDLPVENLKDLTGPVGGCWYVQITALADSSRARVLAAQETSRLGVSVSVFLENGLSKLRTTPCSGYDDATKLRDRIRDSGYEGAFVIRSSANL